MLILCFAGCAETPAAPATQPEWTMQPVAVTLEVGFTQSFTVTDATGRVEPPLDSTIAWEVGDTLIATIDAGTVRARAPGQTVMTAVLDDGSTLQAVVAVEPLRFRQISAGGTLTCGVSVTHRAYCWGRGLLGTLGSGSTRDRLTPTPVVGGHRFRSVSARKDHACGVTPEGVAYCWGWNEVGRLGNGLERGHDSVPAPVMTEQRFATITVGEFSTCALTGEGRAYCWGGNQEGQLGDGTTTDRWTPVPVAGDLRFTSITVGQRHACAVSVSYEGYCWGLNLHGRLGDGTTETRLVPTPMAGGIRFRSIKVAILHGCGVDLDGLGYCWGKNYRGRLGTGDPLNRSIPTRVATDVRLAGIMPGGTFACALAEAGEVLCWGSNLIGKLGRPWPELRESGVPLVIPGAPRFQAITTGTHVCGESSQGLVLCWGSNAWGQHGVGYYSLGGHELVMPIGQVPPGT